MRIALAMTAGSPGARGVGDVQLSVVVPVYGCAECLVTLHQRLTRTLGPMIDSYELVFVDDRSVDDGWAVLQRLARERPARDARSG